MDEQSYKVAYIKQVGRNKEIQFCLEEMPALPPFAYTFRFDIGEEVGLWASTTFDDEVTLTFILDSTNHMKKFLDNELLLALLILSSRLSLKKKQDNLRHEIENIFQALGIKLKWQREADHILSILDTVLLSNSDLLSFQDVYYQKKSEINIDTVGTIKQFNAFNHVKELAMQLLENVLQETNPIQKYDEMMEDLKMRYVQLAATNRIRTPNRKYNFEKLEAQIHTKLIQSLQKPVVTIESEPDRNCMDIGDLFQLKFSQIDDRVLTSQFGVEDFKQAINNFVKDVATDLQSQESLIVLMEFLLAKTFGFFDTKDKMNVDGREALATAMFDTGNEHNFRQEFLKLNKRHKQLLERSKKERKTAEDMLWAVDRKYCGTICRLEELMREKEHETKANKDRIRQLEQLLENSKKMQQQKEGIHKQALSELNNQLEKVKANSPMSTPDDRELLSQKSKSPGTQKSIASTFVKKPLQNRFTVSMKELPPCNIPKEIAKPVDLKPKTFFKKPQNQTQLVKSPRGADALKKGQPTLKKSEQSATLINNINAIFSYVKEQSKNISQRATIRGKENNSTAPAPVKK